MESKFNCPETFLKENQQFRAFLYSDYNIEPHYHDLYEMNIVLKGTGTHQIEDCSFRVRSGDVFVIPPKIVHSYYHTDQLDVFHILFRKSFLSNHQEAYQIPGFLQLTEIEPFLRQNFSKARFLHLSQKELLHLEIELSVLDDKAYNETDYSLLKYHTLWKLICLFSALLHRQLQQPEKKLRYENQILQSLETIHRHYGEKITIDSLCKAVFMSRSTFLRSFQHICGCSPIDYLNRYRKERAWELIEQGMLSKTEIAHLCGFYDLSHMERMIKQTIQ
ncbi:MAG: helix-turn-helix domain-containing protein [Ruminococcaceae bacterium]|nr:helix-turn-helix domain-containing protein [Oscillospiraceae bacterium]